MAKLLSTALLALLIPGCLLRGSTDIHYHTHRNSAAGSNSAIR